MTIFTAGCFTQNRGSSEHSQNPPVQSQDSTMQNLDSSMLNPSSSIKVESPLMRNPGSSANASVPQDEPKPKTLVEALSYFDISIPGLFEQREVHWKLLLAFAHGSKNLELLRQTANLKGTKSVFACFVLFRIRDNPELRLRAVMDKLVGGEHLDKVAAAHLLVDGLDRQDDSPYAPLIAEYLSKGEYISQHGVAMALLHFPDSDQALEKIMSFSGGNELQRSGCAFDLGELLNITPSYMQDSRVMSCLFGLLNDNSPVVRGNACDSIAKHGYAVQSVSELLKVMRNDSYPGVRQAAVVDLSIITAGDELLAILHEAQKDPSPQVADEATSRLPGSDSEGH
jgi:hypothetical protein